jgi:hypothetical protein
MNSSDIDTYILKENEKVDKIKYPNHCGKRVLRKCKRCGCIFETLSIKVRKKGEFFCSRDCHLLYRKENSMSKKERLERGRIYQKKCKYGLTESEYKNMFASQNNKCAICGIDIKDNGVVDHSHITNKVRGILCNKCNVLLGMARDNVDILKKAIDYLQNK